MKIHQLLLAGVLAVTGTLAAHLVAPSTARAQSTTTGGIQGVVVDKKDGSPLVGVTVIATSASLGQANAQTALTDEKGTYRISDLPPGDYKVTFFYADITIEVNDVHVGVNSTTPVYQKIDQSAAGGEVIKLEAKAPLIDPTKTDQGITLDTKYLNNIPVPGRTFDSALGAAAGSTGDDLGVAFSGSTSVENQYYVDGVNTTGLTFGTVGSPVVNDFIEEIDIITGGYNAEFGRATGGIVNVVTKSGSNEFKGAVWGYYQPGFLTAAAQVTPINATSIDAVGNINFNADFGFEVGGPIIKDKLWYFIGFDPAFQQVDITRTTKRETNCRLPVGTPDPLNPGQTIQQGTGDGAIPGLSDCRREYGMVKQSPDIDPRTGFYLTDRLDSEVRSTTGHTYNLLAKINYAATPEHQGQLSFSALPSAGQNPNIFGPADQGSQYSDLTTDLSAKWTSKFNDNKTEVEAVLGWHRDYVTTDPLNQMYAQAPLQTLNGGNLYTYGMGFGETPQTIKGCQSVAEGNGNAYIGIEPCPMLSRSYEIGGIGYIARDTEQRFAGRIGVTQRAKLAGTHEIKAGIDAEDNTSNKSRSISGGGIVQQFAGVVYTDRYAQIGGQVLYDNKGNIISSNPDPSFFTQDNSANHPACSTPNPAGGTGMSATLNFYCAYLSGTPGGRGTLVQGQTINWAAYLRDSWQIQPNLTFNYGVRYEEQRMRYASFLQHTTDVLTGAPLGTDAMVLSGNWAPRIGLLYDWTKEGKSKIYGNFGRYYEAIPMDINDRSFGGEVTYEQVWSDKLCGPTDPRIGAPNGVGCLNNTMRTADLLNHLIGATGELIAPGLQAEYMDEYIAGAEYEVLDDLKIGVAYQHRAFGRIIEDVSTDGANTYVVANPGEWSTAEEKKLETEVMLADPCVPNMPCTKQRLQHELDLFRGIRSFDKGTRDYNALQFTLTRRFSKALYVQGSYTYSRTQGNYPGSYSPDNGQLDPNISSQFDLIELLANRNGPLPQDRPHYIKLDGYYTFDFKRKGSLTIGIRLRALSGTPENALGAHYLYGPNESFLLPRGELGRSDFDHGLDARIIYGKDLKKGMKLEVFFDAFNLYDRQGTYAVDNTYAPPVKFACTVITATCMSNAGTAQNANPISGGTYEDLIWVKTIDQGGGETPTPIGRNPNFHNTTVRYAPAYGRFGLRLTF